MYLGNGCHRDRCLVNPAEMVTPVCTQGLSQSSFNSWKRDRRRIVLQLLKRFNVFLWQHVRPTTEELGRLDPESAIATTQGCENVGATAMTLVTVFLADSSGIYRRHPSHGCQGA